MFSKLKKRQIFKTEKTSVSIQIINFRFW